MVKSKKSVVMLSAATAALICLLVYLRALSCGFVHSDDPSYVLENAGIRHLDLNLISSAFTEKFADDYWMPLVWISLAIDYYFWGLNPLGYHLTNILLHATNAGLVVLIAARLVRGKADPQSELEWTWKRERHQYSFPAMLLLAGLLWGIHPLRVESVVWVAERKDVLNGIFALGSILCYLCYAQNKEGGVAKGYAAGYYLLSLTLFTCSLMAKPVSVVIPAMLLVADWYPLGRWQRGKYLKVLLEKVTYLFLSAAASAVIILIKHHLEGGLTPLRDLPIGLRFVVSGNAIFEYVRLFLFPVGIIPYNVLSKSLPYMVAVKAAVVLLGMCLWIALGRKKPWIIAAGAAFILPLLPVLPFFHNGNDIAFAARFTYLPSIVPSIVAAVLIFNMYSLVSWRWQRYFVIFLAVTSLSYYGYMTQRLIGVWDNSGTYWSRVIDVKPLGRAYEGRGYYLYTQGRYSEAIDDFTKAIGIASKLGLPMRYNLYAHRGEAFRSAERYSEAVDDFTMAIMMRPELNYYFHRGISFGAMGKLEEAEADLARAGTETGPLEWYQTDHR